MSGSALENFADKWADYPRKQRIFFEWLDAVEREYKNPLTDRGFEKVGEYLAESYGQREVKAAMVKYASRQTVEGKSVPGASVILVPSRSKPFDKASYPEIEVSKPSKPWMFSGIKFELDSETCFFVPESGFNAKKQPSVNMINQKNTF